MPSAIMHSRWILLPVLRTGALSSATDVFMYVDRHFVSAQLQAQQRIGGKHYVLLRVAAAQQAERTKHLLDSRTLLGVQAAYYYNSFIGPVGGSVGYSNRTKQAYLFLNIGYEF